jgi:hypothetical protein
MPARRINNRFGPCRVPTESGFYSKGCENFDDVEESNVEDRRKVRSTGLRESISANVVLAPQIFDLDHCLNIITKRKNYL